MIFSCENNIYSFVYFIIIMIYINENIKLLFVLIYLAYIYTVFTLRITGTLSYTIVCTVTGKLFITCCSDADH